ncbi:hypothetical protein CLAFUW4_14537 [Fulvia fulva]|uniref:F-box domain-containing protein n=1 Tax=Passalora fulva TaxID=5499 RepID=A0A9Q8PMS0_PASFU|nr:uncharacterized protein CLAFUR5_14368 [Fulvia fulva]UJO25288.1 hypothetical protein CLAFUR5_14368 [Fulvia fulva]WPV22778.1 hypothetical protein CLAFUW4_14537 [Fulvia fulva]
MARRRRPLRDSGKLRESSAYLRPMNATLAASVSETGPTLPNGVLRAQAKHRNNSTTVSETNVEPSLADRFNALPTELRAEVFSHLLVRPVKWDVEHHHDCPRRSSDEDLTPFICDCDCAVDHHRADWRKRQYEQTKPKVSPWRSQWAPEQANPYVCSDCYHERALRPGPHPRTSSLPCLCARRENLQILLVCRKWYEEAAMVFYTKNIFAFEDGFSFVSFVTYMNSRWRQVISHISIMVVSLDIWPDEVVTWIRDTCEGASDDLLRVRLDSVSIWTRLRQLPALTYLELDHCFLTRTRTVRRMQRLGLKGVKQVCFTQSLSADQHPEWARGTPTVWPAYAGRKLLVEGFAGEMARMIKGQRQKKLKNKSKLEELMLDFRVEIGEAERRVEWWEV